MIVDGVKNLTDNSEERGNDALKLQAFSCNRVFALVKGTLDKEIKETLEQDSFPSLKNKFSAYRC